LSVLQMTVPSIREDLRFKLREIITCTLEQIYRPMSDKDRSC
jgi:hypothetical protein